MPSFGNTNSANAQPAPKFGSTGAPARPKLDQLVGELVIIEPKRLEKVAKYDNRDDRFEDLTDAQKQDRLIADVVALTGPLVGEYPGMWVQQSTIVREAKRILNVTTDTTEMRVSPDGTTSEAYVPDGPALDEVLAGRVIRKPKKGKGFNSPAELEAAIKAAGGTGMFNNSTYSWVVETMNSSDTKLAMAYYATGRELPAADEVSEEDLFED